MAEVQAAQPVDAHNAQAEASPQEAAQQQAKPTTPGASYLGDNLIPDAEMVYDQKRTSEYSCDGSLAHLHTRFDQYTNFTLTPHQLRARTNR